jgi:HSP20 family protein
MSIVRWAPFSAFNSLEREFQTLLDRFNRGPWLEGFPWKPMTDIYKDDRGLIVRSEIAGIDPKEGVTIEVEGNVLRVHGEKKLEHESEEDDRYLRECQYGAFSREVLLPEGVDAESIVATYENGILEIVVPVPTDAAEEPKKVRVEVQTGELVSV